MLKKISTRLLLSLALITVAGAFILGATFALFSDTETSTGNVLAAGDLDLKVDNTSYYNGEINPGTTWLLSNLDDGNGPASNGAYLFFDFDDLKPSDFGEDTISLHSGNDSWVCADFTLTENNDNTCTEPENLDDLSCTEPNQDSFDGELAQNIEFAFWADDGDNVLETDEEVVSSGSAQSVLNSPIVLADAATNNIGGIDGSPMTGGVTHYIAKAWCFGDLGLEPLDQDNEGPESERTPANSSGGITCDGLGLNNETQTDKIMANVNFATVQARHNPGFLCEGGEVTPTPTPSSNPTPTPQACQQADVMLVLDRSGSINSTELTDLKTAAKDFVDSLGLTPLGVHAGQSSFSSTATLDHILSSNDVTLKAAIDAISSGGLTNLKSGLDNAAVELSGGNDRPDGSSPDAMIVITDGHPNRPLPSSTADDVAAASATAFKGGGGTIFVVGVGADVNTAYLQGIATDVGHYYPVTNYSDLQTALEDIDLCEQ